MYLFEILDIEIQTVPQAEFPNKKDLWQGGYKIYFEERKCVFKRPLNLQKNTSFKRPHLTAIRDFQKLMIYIKWKDLQTVQGNYSKQWWSIKQNGPHFPWGFFQKKTLFLSPTLKL